MGSRFVAHVLRHPGTSLVEAGVLIGGLRSVKQDWYVFRAIDHRERPVPLGLDVHV